MNDKIKELAREAAKITDDRLECWGEFHADYGTTWNEVFTELIVKECIKACDGNHEYKNHTDTFFGKGIAEGIQICKIQITDRFGVEV